MSKRAKVIAAIVGFGVLSAPFGAYVAVTLQSNQLISRSLAKLKALGYLTTKEEIDRQRPPEEQNAAPIYQKLFKEFEKRSILPRSFMSPVPPEWAFVYTQNRAFVDRIDEVRSKPKFWIDWPLEQGDYIKFEEASLMVELAFVCLSMALVEGDEGETERPIARLKTARVIANHLLQGPFYDCAAMGTRIERQILETTLLLASKNRNLRFRQAVRLEARSTTRISNPRLFISSQTILAKGEIDPYPHHGEDWHWNLEFMKHRARSLRIEAFALWAELLEDGYQPSDTTAMENLDRQQTSRDFLNAQIKNHYGYADDFATVDEIWAQQSELIQIYLDVLIEDSGGPEANVPNYAGVRKNSKSVTITGKNHILTVGHDRSFSFDSSPKKRLP